MKKFFKVMFVFLVCGGVFLGGSYYYLFFSPAAGQKQADKTEENIPYYDPPANCRLNFMGENGEKTVIVLDFTEKISYIIYIQDSYAILDNYINYSETYDFYVTGDLLSLIIDRLGGADVTAGGEALRLTGVQAQSALLKNDDPLLRRDIILSLVNRVAARGFSEDDFVFLIENTGTKLTLPTCIYWQKYIKDVFKNPVFIT